MNLNPMEQFAVKPLIAEPLFALDENDFFARVGRVKGRCVTAGAGAHDYNFSFDRIHTN